MVVTRAKFYGAENSDASNALGDGTDDFVNGAHADPLTQSMLDKLGGVPDKADQRDAGGGGNGGGNSGHGGGGNSGGNSGKGKGGGATAAAPTHGGATPGNSQGGGAQGIPAAHPVTGTPNPKTTGAGQGNIMKGGRGGR